MSPSDLQWWGWIVLSALLWIIGRFASAEADESIPINVHTTFWWIVHALVTIGSILSTLIGVIRFIKWVWGG